MTNLLEFSRNAAQRYLQSIVFVDDEIYKRDTGEPVELSADILPFKSPFVHEPGAVQIALPAPGIPVEVGAGAAEPSSSKVAGQAAPDGAAVPVVAPTAETPSAKPPYHPRQLVESFTREGMVCALYEPRAGFSSGSDSEIFKLCERADVLILDWDLFGADGSNIMPLIANLIDLSQNTIPHHARLCAIYTNKPDLRRVANAVYEDLRRRGLASEPAQITTLVAGATRVVVWGKPNVAGRSAESKFLEVPEEQLAGRIIDEFAGMHRGILPSYALHGMASVRRNSKRILDKFHGDMDGEFLLHRASLLAKEDAFEQLPELLAEEVLAVLLDDQVPLDVAGDIGRALASGLNLGNLDWPPVDHTSIPQRQELARRFLGAGAEAIADEYKVKAKDPPFERFHREMGCNETHADKRLAALFNLRTRYVTTNPPNLGLGTVVRWHDPESLLRYGLCLMPVCDSIRLDPGAGPTTMFPFWTLKRINEGDGPGFVVQTTESTFLDLLVAGKPRDMLWMDRFTPGPSRTVVATEENSSFWFRGESRRLEWVAQLKPAHAQRIALHIGQAFSRVAVLEAEWLRLLSDRKGA